MREVERMRAGERLRASQANAAAACAAAGEAAADSGAVAALFFQIEFHWKQPRSGLALGRQIHSIPFTTHCSAPRHSEPPAPAAHLPPPVKVSRASTGGIGRHVEAGGEASPRLRLQAAQPLLLCGAGTYLFAMKEIASTALLVASEHGGGGTAAVLAAAASCAPLHCQHQSSAAAGRSIATRCSYPRRKANINPEHLSG